MIKNSQRSLKVPYTNLNFFFAVHYKKMALTLETSFEKLPLLCAQTIRRCFVHLEFVTRRIGVYFWRCARECINFSLTRAGMTN